MPNQVKPESKRKNSDQLFAYYLERLVQWRERLPILFARVTEFNDEKEIDKVTARPVVANF